MYRIHLHFYSTIKRKKYFVIRVRKLGSSSPLMSAMASMHPYWSFDRRCHINMREQSTSQIQNREKHNFKNILDLVNTNNQNRTTYGEGIITRDSSNGRNGCMPLLRCHACNPSLNNISIVMYIINYLQFLNSQSHGDVYVELQSWIKYYISQNQSKE